MNKKILKRIEIRNSSISGYGIFAVSNFEKGETVLKWNPAERFDSSKLSQFTEEQKHYISHMPDGTYLLQGEPERFINHSCNPNTTIIGEADVALRDIEAGEEITGFYLEDGVLNSFQCQCGAKNCIGKI